MFVPIPSEPMNHEPVLWPLNLDHITLLPPPPRHTVKASLESGPITELVIQERTKNFGHYYFTCRKFGIELKEEPRQVLSLHLHFSTDWSYLSSSGPAPQYQSTRNPQHSEPGMNNIVFSAKQQLQLCSIKTMAWEEYTGKSNNIFLCNCLEAKALPPESGNID